MSHDCVGFLCLGIFGNGGCLGVSWACLRDVNVIGFLCESARVMNGGECLFL